MGRVPTSPRSGRSYDRDRRDVRGEIARLDRKESRPPVPLPFVKVEPVAVEEWPPGTAWLDTSGEV